MQMRSVAPVRLRPLRGTDVSLLRGVLLHEGLDASWVASFDFTQQMQLQIQQRQSWALVGCVGPLDRAVCIVIGTAVTEVSDVEHTCGAAPGDIEIAYWTHPDFRGRGLTRHAVDQAAARFAQDLQPGGKLIAHAEADNHASRAILDNLSSHQLVYDDCVCFSLTGKVA